MGEQILYRELAKYYDRVYHWKDYDDDVERLLSMIRSHKGTANTNLLDIGCGTGAHIAKLVNGFDCTGIDNNDEMLRVAREKVPTASFIRADMRDFDLGRRFDIIISMFGTIGYATSLEDLQRVVDSIATHLVPGGVAVLEPFISKDDYIPGHVAMTTYEDDDVKISRVSTSRMEDDVCLFEMHYLIGEKGEGVSYFLDTHTMRLFTPQELLTAMDVAGLSAEFDPVGFGQKRGALIATKDEK